MGATITAAWIDENAAQHRTRRRQPGVPFARAAALQQLTSDHSLVAEQVRRGILTPAEAERSEMQSVLLRALGAHAEIEVDSEEHTLFGSDVLLLCSDGLTRMVTEPEIAGTLQAEPDPSQGGRTSRGISE